MNLEEIIKIQNKYKRCIHREKCTECHQCSNCLAPSYFCYDGCTACQKCGGNYD